MTLVKQITRFLEKIIISFYLLYIYFYYFSSIGWRVRTSNSLGRDLYANSTIQMLKKQIIGMSIKQIIGMSMKVELVQLNLEIILCIKYKMFNFIFLNMIFIHVSTVMGRFRLEDIVNFIEFVLYLIKKSTKLQLENHTLGPN